MARERYWPQSIGVRSIRCEVSVASLDEEVAAILARDLGVMARSERSGESGYKFNRAGAFRTFRITVGFAARDSRHEAG
jgi:hypothetical protein